MNRCIQIAISVIIVASCAPIRFQPSIDTHTNTSRIDSITVFDSVFIDRIRIVKEKADTVYVTEWKTEYKYRYLDRVKNDTMILIQTKTEMVEVDKELTKWQKFRMDTGGWALGAIVVVLAVLILKIVRKFL